MDAKTLDEQHVEIVAAHYGLPRRQIRNLEVVVFKVMLRHIGRGRPCDHPGGILTRP